VAGGSVGRVLGGAMQSEEQGQGALRAGLAQRGQAAGVAWRRLAAARERHAGRSAEQVQRAELVGRGTSELKGGAVGGGS
jgi:hypothetical protein